MQTRDTNGARGCTTVALAQQAGNVSTVTNICEGGGGVPPPRTSPDCVVWRPKRDTPWCNPHFVPACFILFEISVLSSDWVGFRLSDRDSGETVGIHRAPGENTPG